MTAKKILVIDSSRFTIGKLHQILDPAGFDFVRIDSVSSYNDFSSIAPPGLVILVSTREKVEDTIQSVQRIMRSIQGTPLILISKYSSEALVISAFRAGISDYFNAPFSDQLLLTSIRKHMPAHTPPTSHVKGRAGKSTLPTGEMVGSGKVMRKIKQRLSNYAATDCTVMITGETGTGKDMAAKLVYLQSKRKQRPFVCLNCAALPESLVESELFGFAKGAFTGAVTAKKGKFEQASGGTLFLDEIGEMSPLAQAKILRTIENKTVYPLSSSRAVNLDVRLIAATNQDFEQLVADGKFRKDLYYRLNVAQVKLPPLRERKEDIPDLVTAELSRLNQRFDRNIAGVSEEALSSFFVYDWPGNIRELKNTIEVAFIDCADKKIRFSDLPDAMTKKLKFAKTNGSPNDRDMLLAALSSTRWNKSKAARKLKWSRMRVYRTLERYNLH